MYSDRAVGRSRTLFQGPTKVDAGMPPRRGRPSSVREKGGLSGRTMNSTPSVGLFQGPTKVGQRIRFRGLVQSTTLPRRLAATVGFEPTRPFRTCQLTRYSEPGSRPLILPSGCFDLSAAPSSGKEGRRGVGQRRFVRCTPTGSRPDSRRRRFVLRNSAAAEGAGFEPARAERCPNGLASRRLKPLGHPPVSFRTPVIRRSGSDVTPISKKRPTKVGESSAFRPLSRPHRHGFPMPAVGTRPPSAGDSGR